MTDMGLAVKPIHKEVLNKKKVEMLKIAATHVIETMRNDFPLNELLGNTSFYNNFQKLRYHGLVHHVTVNGTRKRGHWLITRNGWAFLRGELDLPAYVLVQGNRVFSRSDRRVFLKDVWAGSGNMATSFEYFDEYGKPVGFRPVVSPVMRKEQLVLI